MVLFPKVIRTHCPNRRCRKHRRHKVSIYKKSKDRPNALGTRRYRIKQRGFGGQTRPIFHKNAKTTKKVVLKLQCTTCKKYHTRTMPRCRSFQLVAPKRGGGKG